MARYAKNVTKPADPADAEIHELVDNEAGIRAGVASFSGAELSSLQVRCGSEWSELIYRANDFSPCEDWRGRAPFLWPAVGRNFSQEQVDLAARTGEEPVMGRYRIGETEYDMPCHGFVMEQPWEVASHLAEADRAEVTCALDSGDYGRAMYPFDYCLEVQYVLQDSALTVNFTANAGPANTDAMPFSVGNHISLKFPFMSGPGSRWDVGLLQGSARKEYGIDDLSLFDGSASEKDFRDGLSLSDPSHCNGVTGGADGPCWLELIEPGAMSVKMSQRVPAGWGMEEHLYFVLWGDPAEGYFCPEPWVGGPNSLNTGEGLVRLPPGESFTWTFKAEIIDRSR